MLNHADRPRVAGKVKHLTDAYRIAKAHGRHIVAIGVPKFASQADHDAYHPGEEAEDYKHFNEFAAEILLGLARNGVPAKLLTVHYSDYENWLKGRPNSSELRSDYSEHLVAKLDRGKSRS
jgi:hypothetical protein